MSDENSNNHQFDQPGDDGQRPRRNLSSIIIEPFKQFKFGSYVVGLSVAFTALFGLTFVSAFRDQYAHVMSIFEVVDPKMHWELILNDVFYTNAIRVGLLFAAYIGILMTVVFRLTHRYYGPLVSIQRFVDDIKKGNYSSRCKIRERDEMQDLVANLNNMAEKLEQRHGKKWSPTAEETPSEHDQAS